MRMRRRMMPKRSDWDDPEEIFRHRINNKFSKRFGLDVADYVYNQLRKRSYYNPEDEYESDSMYDKRGLFPFYSGEMDE